MFPTFHFDQFSLDLTLPIRVCAAAGFGILVGLERRYHGHAAGPHTCALVAAGSAMFVTSGLLTGTSVFGQLVTGIGFICGGVILHDGMTVKGLNTAATLWSLAAISALTGAGHLDLGAGATLLVITLNITLRWVEQHVPLLNRPQTPGDTAS